MTAKEFLQQYLQAERGINAKLEEISRLRSLAMRTTQVLEKDKVFVQSSAGDRMAAIVDKIVDLEREVDQEIDKLQDIKREVLSVINAVRDSKLRAVLQYRYICGNTFEEIASAMRYSWRHIIRLHGQALKKIKDGIECHI